jgi:hypothetical protein
MAILNVCPIESVNTRRVITFKPEATEQQKQAAQVIADSWDFAAPDQQEVIDAAARDAAKADAVIQYLVNHTPAECADYVQSNVTDLASAKQFLKKVAMALSMLARSELR